MKKGVSFGFLSYLILLVFTLSLVSFISAGTLQVTEEHPFLVNGQWVDASQLQVGDVLQTLNGKNVRITSIEDVVLKDNFSVYNLEAKEHSNFIVSDLIDGLEVIVHNSNAIESRFSIIPREKLKPLVTPEISPSKVNDYITNAKTPEIAALRVKAINNLNRVTFNQFESQLIRSITGPGGLNERLADGKPYVVILGRKTHSSPYWVYELSKPFLDKKPVAEVYLTISDMMHPANSPILNLIKEKGITRFVIFEDISYSGTELYGEFLLKFNRLYEAQLGHTSKQVELVFCVPYMSNSAEAFVKGFQTTKGFSFSITSHNYIPTISETFTSTESSVMGFGGVKTLTFADWKIPDSVSFPSQLSLNKYGIFTKGEVAFEDYIPYKIPGTPLYVREETQFNEYSANFPPNEAY